MFKKRQLEHSGILPKVAVKKNLYVLLIVLILVNVIFFFKFKKSNQEFNEPFNKLKTPSDIKISTPICYFSDRVNYQRYDDSLKIGLPQKNIGYVNNKFGLYVYSTENFLKKADELVNSNGGDWGYVLIPYNVRDYDKNKWIKIFDLLSKKHLIPIIQLWDVNLESYEAETKSAAKFLNGFPWPIKNRYVSVYNETNDARFWKGVLDPSGYAKDLDFTIDTFKKQDKNFFMLNGAFNMTAPSAYGYMDEEEYLRKMNIAVPGIFTKLDGWASHPYPQPAFVGSPKDTGRGSIRGYEWELIVLDGDFGVKDLPVFITETGWPHAEGEKYNASYYNSKKVSENISEAFEKVWLPDDRVVAITPFTIYYDPPFDHFSWVLRDGSTYEQFEEVKKIPKLSGRPPVLFPFEKEIITCP